MGFALKKTHSVSSSLSSYNHEPAEGHKFPGIVSTALLHLDFLCLPQQFCSLFSPPSLACCPNISQRRLLGWSIHAWISNLALNFTLSVTTTWRDQPLVDLNASRTQFFLRNKLLLILPVIFFLIFLLSPLFGSSHFNFIQCRLWLVCVCMTDNGNTLCYQVKTLYLQILQA